MTIKEIYKMQEALDNSIIEKKNLNVDPKTLLNTRLLALFVELGELEEEINAWENLTNFMMRKSIKSEIVTVSKEKVLEEYVDCMHFLFSIANSLDIEEYIYETYEIADFSEHPDDILYYEDYQPETCTLSDFLIIFSKFTNYLGNWKYWKKEKEHNKKYLLQKWHEVLISFIKMGTSNVWNFTAEQIEEAYKTKMKKNYERQENNY
ncbi:dimeric dUTPase (all-alpha-NTP-PPase superfamily) [Acetoanaerobium pronyense]|uniref:Dimeric dUTPase (All-alpha-NTP-PPase superfamily) n=1 Tax=Acetoanaerobium pronyense TaxID=1482736 RepID=A0ABS4KJB2_9FIRM|nr:dUTP diphosphatase [Acetoanaerobium pronyense]MBP2027420.1 dimeric dUTPase (all-alpha-NTP-PPase superfamily) [Acetoanaerobium pronyense]